MCIRILFSIFSVLGGSILSKKGQIVAPYSSFLFPLLHLHLWFYILSKPHNEMLEIQHYRQWGGRGGGAFSRGHHISTRGRRKAVHRTHTTNEGPGRILYKCLVPIYVFPEMKLGGLVISQTKLPCSDSQLLYTHISVRDLYISRIGLSILL